MRRYGLVLVLVLTAALFSSCNGSFGTIVPNFGRYDLTFNKISITASYRNHEGASDGFETLVSEFNNKNNFGITIELTESGDCDLAVTGPAMAAELLRSGKSIELSPLVYHPVWGIEGGRRRFLSAARKQTDYWDFARKITSLPLAMDAYVLLVNNDSLEEAGLKRFPSTWVMFFRDLKRLASDESAAMGMSEDAASVVSLIIARGGSVLKPVGSSYSIFNPVTNRSLRFLRNAERDGLLYAERSSYSVQSGFAFGKIPLVFVPTDSIPIYAEFISMVNPGMDWRPALMPTKRPGSGSVINCTHTAVIMKTGAERELASWLFIKWLTEAEQQLRLAVLSNSVPVSRPALSEILNEHFDFFTPQWLDAVELIAGSHMDTLPGLYDYEWVGSGIESMLGRIYNGKWIWLETLRLDSMISRKRREEINSRAGGR